MPEIPSLGFAAQRAPADQVFAAASQAISSGCRFLEISAAMGSEEPISRALKQALRQNASLKREDFFIVSILPNVYHRPEYVSKSVSDSLTMLETSYIDCLVMGAPVAFTPYADASGKLIYFPKECEWDDGCGHEHATCHKFSLDPVPVLKTWSAMESLVDAGLCKHIGVGNFTIALLHDLFAGARIRPSVLYTEVHPLFQNRAMLAYAAGVEHKMHVVSFLPLAGGCEQGGPLAQIPLVEQLADKYRCTPAQIILAWHLHTHPKNYSVTVRCLNLTRVSEAFAAKRIELEGADFKQLSALESGNRVFTGSVNFGFPLFA